MKREKDAAEHVLERTARRRLPTRIGVWRRMKKYSASFVASPATFVSLANKEVDPAL